MKTKAAKKETKKNPNYDWVIVWIPVILIITFFALLFLAFTRAAYGAEKNTKTITVNLAQQKLACLKMAEKLQNFPSRVERIIARPKV